MSTAPGSARIEEAKCRKIKTALDYRDGGSDQCVLLTGRGPPGMHYDALVLRQVASAPASRGKRSKAVREAQKQPQR